MNDIDEYLTFIDNKCKMPSGSSRDEPEKKKKKRKNKKAEEQKKKNEVEKIDTDLLEYLENSQIPDTNFDDIFSPTSFPQDPNSIELARKKIKLSELIANFDEDEETRMV